MTGQLRLRPRRRSTRTCGPGGRSTTASVLELRDVRRFGRIAVVPAGEYAALPTLATQGPEPWDPALDDGGLWRNLQAQPGAR